MSGDTAKAVPWRKPPGISIISELSRHIRHPRKDSRPLAHFKFCRINRFSLTGAAPATDSS
jgi:hypothetical protein